MDMHVFGGFFPQNTTAERASQSVSQSVSRASARRRRSHENLNVWAIKRKKVFEERNWPS